MNKTNRNNIVVYSTKNSYYFAEKIAKRLGLPEPARIDRNIFSDGEKYYRLGISERSELVGKTAIVVASTHTDDDFLELYRIGCTLAGCGTRKRIFVIPFMGYSTMERAVLPGEVVTAKTNIKMLSNIPNSGAGNSFLFFDLHADGLVHYFEGDCLRFELYGGESLVKALKQKKLKNFMFGSADLGRPKWVKYFAEKFNASKELAFVYKVRTQGKSEVKQVIGDVKGKNVIIYDDMSRSFNTLINAADAYLDREHGANSVAAVLSHLAVSSEDIIKKIIRSPLKWVVHTNSHPMSQHPLVKKSKKFIEVDISEVYVKAIKPLLTV